MKIVYKAFEQVPVLGNGQFALKEVGEFVANYDGERGFMSNEFSSVESAHDDIYKFYYRHPEGERALLIPANANNLIILPVLKVE